jgi:hypothetical protein
MIEVIRVRVPAAFGPVAQWESASTLLTASSRVGQAVSDPADDVEQRELTLGQNDACGLCELTVQHPQMRLVGIPVVVADVAGAAHQSDGVGQIDAVDGQQIGNRRTGDRALGAVEDCSTDATVWFMRST